MPRRVNVHPNRVLGLTCFFFFVTRLYLGLLAVEERRD